LGKRQHFSDLRGFFDNLVATGQLEGFLAKHGPTLLEGSIGALTHALIHTGWAIDAENPQMLAEGLAYLIHAHLPLHSERFQANMIQEESPFASLIRISREYHSDHLQQWAQQVINSKKYNKDSGFRAEIRETGFQWQLSKIIEEGHDLLYKLPSWLDDLPVSTIFEELHKSVTLLYTATTCVETSESVDLFKNPGNFFILHLITSLWGLEFLLLKLPSSQHRFALKVFWVSMLALLFTSKVTAHFFTERILSILHKKYWTVVDSTAESVTQSWKETVDRALKDEEEHNIKLVYVEQQLYERYHHWSLFRLAASNFTPTPNVS
jgi:hypothetical protein